MSYFGSLAKAKGEYLHLVRSLYKDNNTFIKRE